MENYPRAEWSPDSTQVVLYGSNKLGCFMVKDYRDRYVKFTNNTFKTIVFMLNCIFQDMHVDMSMEMQLEIFEWMYIIFQQSDSLSCNATYVSKIWRHASSVSKSD